MAEHYGPTGELLDSGDDPLRLSFFQNWPFMEGVERSNEAMIIDSSVHPYELDSMAFVAQAEEAILLRHPLVQIV